MLPLVLYLLYLYLRPKHKIIGLTGYKGSGKDTAANFMWFLGYKRFAFADNLKKICEIAFGLSHAQLHGNAKEIIDTRYNLTPRQIMQIVGTDLFKNRFPHIWINAFKNTYIPGKCYVITDVRFEDEAQCIKECGGKIICINRGLKRNDTHISEREIPHDLRVTNTGTKLELYKKIYDLL
jgi:hypothetical protein